MRRGLGSRRVRAQCLLGHGTLCGQLMVLPLPLPPLPQLQGAAAHTRLSPSGTGVTHWTPTPRCRRCTGSCCWGGTSSGGHPPFPTLCTCQAAPGCAPCQGCTAELDLGPLLFMDLGRCRRYTQKASLLGLPSAWAMTLSPFLGCRADLPGLSSGPCLRGGPSAL